MDIDFPGIRKKNSLILWFAINFRYFIKRYTLQ